MAKTKPLGLTSEETTWRYAFCDSKGFVANCLKERETENVDFSRLRHRNNYFMKVRCCELHSMCIGSAI